jgi:hypothetical protein
VLKAGGIMTKQKFGTFLGRCWLTGICCAEKINPPDLQKTNRVRLFKV